MTSGTPVTALQGMKCCRKCIYQIGMSALPHAAVEVRGVYRDGVVATCSLTLLNWVLQQVYSECPCSVPL